MGKVAKNATWIIACRIAQAFFALAIYMLTARFLGPSNFGIIIYASSLVAFVAPIMNLGFNNILVQDIINNPEREGKTVGTTILLSLISAVFCISGITTFAYIANQNEFSTIIVCFLYSLLLIFQALELIQYWFQAKYLSKYTSIVTLCAYLVVSAYKVFLLVTQKSVYWFAISNAFDYCLIGISLIVIYRKLGGQKLEFSLGLGKELFSRSKHYILSSMMVTIFAQTDKIMIKSMLGETATGFYGAAVACAGLTSFIFTAIIDSFRPSILEAYEEDTKAFEYRLTLLYSIIIYLSLSQSIIMTIFARSFIIVLYGPAYEASIGALQAVVWYTTFSYMGAIRDVWILANNKQNVLWKINMSGAIANVIINWLLIPRFGIYGASAASIITQFFTNVVTGFIMKQIRPNNFLMINGLDPRLIIGLLRRMISRERK
ncbi:flippase [uncultured Dysosmobacter sp.]|uniref:flippase n=1 Tax=uncultured Dysosmobacter sp. TaxID=2591384 RepID=UPI0026092248|nr:flippase [uncultured Dysosmobacter sp.]